jgi:hypothetical protein
MARTSAPAVPLQPQPVGWGGVGVQTPALQLRPETQSVSTVQLVGQTPSAWHT